MRFSDLVRGPYVAPSLFVSFSLTTDTVALIVSDPNRGTGFVGFPCSPLVFYDTVPRLG